MKTHFLRSKAVAIAVLPQIFLSAPIIAAETKDLDETKEALTKPTRESSTQATQTIVVTATRTANTVDETMAPVTVIDREDIETLQASSLVELLSTTPSLDISTSGGLGSHANIHLRGTNSDHILTLIDGVPVGSATAGNMALQYLPVNQIERIEIVRGPRSSLYGADAIGGVIQIFTRKDENKQSQVYADVGYGSDQTRELNAGISGSYQNTQYQLSAGHTQTNGYNYIGTGVDDDDDGHDKTAVSLNINHQINDDLKIGALMLRSEGNSEYDGSYVNNTDFVEQVISGHINATLAKNWDSLLQINRSDSKSDNFLDNQKRSRFNTKRYSMSWKNDLQLNPDSLLVVGADYSKDYVDSSTDFDETTRWNRAVFAQLQHFGEHFDSSASVRHDDNEAYGKHNTWNMAFGFPLDESIRLTSSLGTAFKAPSFNDLYYPLENYPAYSPGLPTSSYSGNPDLEPEQATNFDFGIDANWQQHQWSARFFKTKVEDLIEYISELNEATNNYDGTMKNISNADIKGLEISYSTELWNWQIKANYSLIDAKNDDTNMRLPNRSEQLFNLHLDREHGNYSYGASLVAASDRYIDTEEQYQLGGYGIINLRTAYSINKQWTLKGKIDNLFDKNYALNARYALSGKYRAPGRMIFASLHYKM